MIIKTPKARIPLIIALLVLCIVAVLTINKEQLKEEAYTILDKTIAQDWGFASLTGLFGIPLLKELAPTTGGKIFALIKLAPERVLIRLPQIIGSKITRFSSRPPIERLDIDIKFEHYQTILKDRKHALNMPMLVEAHEVPAKIRYKGKTYKTKLRLKGRLSDHWRSRTRMSLRISLKGKKTIKEYNRFSLHKPGSRQYPYDQIFHALIHDSQGLATPESYVRVVVNGDNWGIMNIEEHVSKELLEKQRAKESIILELGDNHREYSRTVSAPYKNYRLTDDRLFISLYQKNKYLRQDLPRQHYSYVAEKILMHEKQDILDMNSYSRAAFFAILWNNFHAIAQNNMRIYFNPYTLKIEPIIADQGNFNAIEGNNNPLLLLCNKASTLTFQKLLFSPEGQKSFHKNLKVTLQSAEKIPELYDYYHKFFPNNFPTDLEPVLKNIKKMKALAKPLSKCPVVNVKNQKSQGQAPPTAEQAADLMDHVHVRHYDDGRLLLFNLLDVPVQLEAILYEGKLLETYSDTTVPPYTENDGVLIIQTEKKDIHDNKFTIKTSYGGHDRQTKTEATLITALFNPLESSTNKKLPAYIKRKNSSFVIEAGRWDIQKPLLIDGALMIKAGTELRFAPNAYLIIKGHLTADGTAIAPITFKPLKNNWKGIYVLEAEEQSILRHAIIKDTAALQDGLLALTSGITFYKSPVLIEHTEITGTAAEDALNIVKSDFTIKDSAISNTPSDAFDSDFSKGKIISSKVENIDGDGLDFSGSQVLIDGLSASNIRDKAISAGEKSNITIKNSVFNHVGVGIASKDGSIVTANKISVSDYGLHAAMSYVKKEMFGAPTLKIQDITYEGDAPFSRQKGTNMFVDGKKIHAQKIDVKQLYNSETMKK